MSSERGDKAVSPFLVGMGAWLVPGLGFWLIGQRARGVTVFVSILMLFVAGVLIGGIRVVDPPGYGEYGYKVQLVRRVEKNSAVVVRVDPTTPEEEATPGRERNDRTMGWALTGQFLSEIGNKPWFIGQALCGPVSVVMSAVSIRESHPIFDGNGDPVKDLNGVIQERVPPSHSRSWEIGTLYTAVAGMLNLLAIIDSAYRTGVPEER